MTSTTTPPRTTPPAGTDGGGGDTLLTVAGAGLLFATGGIHLDLYVTGYRLIPTVGWMFLLQVAAAFALALATLAVGRIRSLRRHAVAGAIGLQTLVAASGALFALATLGGYLLSLHVGLFAFKEVRTTAGIVAAILEIAAFVSLGWLATSGITRVPPRAMAVGGLAALAVILLVLGEASAISVGGGSGSPPPGTGGEITVVIKNFAFQPSHPNVRPGERILVKNEDRVAHTFSSRPGVPASVAFSTGAVPPGGSRVVTAPKPDGSYRFQCLIHPFMTGTLTVSNSG